MSQPDNAAATADDVGAEGAVHNIAATKALTTEIRDGLDNLEVGEDVWSDIEVNEDDNPESSVAFTIEGDGGLYYEVRVNPKVD